MIDFDPDLLRRSMMGEFTPGASDVRAQKAKYKRSEYQDVTAGTFEVDIHLQKLTEDQSITDNFEKLTIQLNACSNAIENAIKEGQSEFYIIHGVGKGKLKKEVHKLLKTYNEVKKYSCAYHPRYGMGATKVEFV